jgi:hypothetical protein
VYILKKEQQKKQLKNVFQEANNKQQQHQLEKNVVFTTLKKVKKIVFSLFLQFVQFDRK